MSEILELFPTKIYKDFYPDFRDLKNDLFTKLNSVFDQSTKNNNPFMRDGTICSYQEGSYLHRDFPTETNRVVEFVEQAAKKFWKECDYHEELDPYVFQVWANTTPRGGWIDSHLHGNMPFTAVLYVDADPSKGNIIFDNPMDMVLMSQPISPKVRYPLEKEIPVQSGDLLMFPAYLKHKVLPNTSDDARLIMGFNIGCKGNYWASQWTQN